MQDSATKDVFGIPALCVEQLGPMLKLQVESFKIAHGVKVPWPRNVVNCGIDEVVECQDRVFLNSLWGRPGGYGILWFLSGILELPL